MAGSGCQLEAQLGLSTETPKPGLCIWCRLLSAPGLGSLEEHANCQHYRRLRCNLQSFLWPCLGHSPTSFLLCSVSQGHHWSQPKSSGGHSPLGVRSRMHVQGGEELGKPSLKTVISTVHGFLEAFIITNSLLWFYLDLIPFQNPVMCSFKCQSWAKWHFKDYLRDSFLNLLMGKLRPRGRKH